MPLGSEALSPSASSSAAGSLSGQRLSRRQSWSRDDIAGSAARELQVRQMAQCLISCTMLTKHTC